MKMQLFAHIEIKEYCFDSSFPKTSNRTFEIPLTVYKGTDRIGQLTVTVNHVSILGDDVISSMEEAGRKYLEEVKK